MIIEQHPHTRLPGQIRQCRSTHVDGSARLQTLSADEDPSLRALLTAFCARTGVPLLLNTSFNVMGESLVETPEDALACFDSADIDCLVLGERLISRS